MVLTSTTSLPLPLYPPIGPPAQVTNLHNTTYEEDLITITWNSFEVCIPITGAIIQYAPKGGIARIISTNRTMVTILGLTPLTNYIISVSVISIGGTSVPTYSLIRTLSRSKVDGLEYLFQ